MNGLDGRGVRLCFSDVYATWPQITFGTVLVLLLTFVTIDLFTNDYTLQAMEATLERISRYIVKDAPAGVTTVERPHILSTAAWLMDLELATFFLLFILFGAIAVVLLLPQTVLGVGAGYACAAQIDNSYLAFVVGVSLAFLTFALGATAAFLLARRVLPHSCTKNFFQHFRILEGLDHALQHRGRRINILLRINPLAPYNALNYSLGLSSCSLRAYVEGLLGALPYTCVAVYVGMILTNIDDFESLFTHTGVAWYCVYASFVLACILSFVLVVKYTKAEMDAAASVGPLAAADYYDINHAPGGEGAAIGNDSTVFGTFTSSVRDDREVVGMEEEMTTFLSDEESRQGDASSGGTPANVDF